MPTDEERYAAFLAQAQVHDSDDSDTPLDSVRQLRSAQLAVCDLRKQAELAALHQTAKDHAQQPAADSNTDTDTDYKPDNTDP